MINVKKPLGMRKLIYIVIIFLSVFLIFMSSVGLYHSSLDTRDWFLIASLLAAALLLSTCCQAMMKTKLDLTMKDPLTKAYQRIFLEHNLKAISGRFNRLDPKSDNSTGVIIVDCDNFKLINDKFGHQAGSNILIQFTNILNENLREKDLLIRWGGDEFLIICEDISLKSLDVLSGRLRREVEGYSFPYEAEHIEITSSIGFALHKKGQPFDFDSLVNSADQYLYKSKDSGRNLSIGGFFAPARN